MTVGSRANDRGIPIGEELCSTCIELGFTPPGPAPERREGSGPFQRMVIRNANLIDGTGGPVVGPVDIIIENDRIASIPVFGFSEAISAEGGDYEIDAAGKYVLPGFVDCHTHIGCMFQGVTGEVTPAEYVFKLWLGHGVTTVREAGATNGFAWTRDHEARSLKNEITAPRIVTYPCLPPDGYGWAPSTAADVEGWLDDIQETGVSGVKYFGGPPHIGRALLEGARERGLKSACHNVVSHAARANAVHLAQWGLTSLEHSLSLPECLLETTGGTQPFPADYNYNDEQQRAFMDGVVWLKINPGGSRWNEVMDRLLATGLTLVPTLAIWEQGRDVQRAMWAEWHDKYTWPALWRFFQPGPDNHWGYYRDWTTTMEIEYSRGYRLWMDFVNEYKNNGGRVCAGTDSGFGLKLYGFDFIRELELLQETGLHPLEVVRAATLKGAELLGLEDEIGTIEVGKKADLVIVDENPLDNLKVLYGTGHMRYDPVRERVDRVGGVNRVIKDGIVYDAKALLADVADLVSRAKQAEAGGQPPAGE